MDEKPLIESQANEVGLSLGEKSLSLTPKEILQRLENSQGDLSIEKLRAMWGSLQLNNDSLALLPNNFIRTFLSVLKVAIQRKFQDNSNLAGFYIHNVQPFNVLVTLEGAKNNREIIDSFQVRELWLAGKNYLAQILDDGGRNVALNYLNSYMVKVLAKLNLLDLSEAFIPIVSEKQYLLPDNLKQNVILQIIEELLCNANKYKRNGELKIKVKIEIVENKSDGDFKLKIVVKDEGMGMSVKRLTELKFALSSPNGHGVDPDIRSAQSGGNGLVRIANLSQAVQVKVNSNLGEYTEVEVVISGLSPVTTES